MYAPQPFVRAQLELIGGHLVPLLRAWSFSTSEVRAQIGGDTASDATSFVCILCTSTFTWRTKGANNQGRAGHRLGTSVATASKRPSSLARAVSQWSTDRRFDFFSSFGDVFSCSMLINLT